MQEALQQDLEQVQRVMAGQLADLEEPLRPVLEVYWQSQHQAKMLRSRLFLLCAGCCGPALDAPLALAAALELLHSASLIHDDLIDRSSLRRGCPSAHLRWGEETAVLLGDFLYTRALGLVAELQVPGLLQSFIAAAGQLCEGALLQSRCKGKVGLDRATYQRIIAAKTGALCSCACSLGALAASPQEQAAAAAYGRACGMAYQIIDDCANLSSAEHIQQKSLHTDLLRGRITLPLICAWESLDVLGRQDLERRLQGLSSYQQARSLGAYLEACGACQQARQHAQALLQEARQHLQVLPAHPCRDALEALADQILSHEQPVPAGAAPAASLRPVIILAGAPRVAVDALRYLSVPASGRTAAFLQESLRKQGMTVISLFSQDASPEDEQALRYQSREDLERSLIALIQEHPQAVLVSSAAINDYQVTAVERHAQGRVSLHGTDEKIASQADALLIRLAPTSKLIDQLPDWGHRGPLVAFKYEAAESVLANARALQRRCSATLVVANSLCGRVQSLVDADGQHQDFAHRQELLLVLAEKIADLARH